MTENNKEPVEIKITQEQLVDYLFHAATREDISILRHELKSEIAANKQELKDDLNNSELRLKGEINSLETRVNTQFKWVLGTTIGVGVSICGVMIGLASFLTHYIQH